ncbi:MULTISPECIES: heme-binding protein [unclassified Pelagibacterium]|uniref:GlcG/HbpS family heme-binding protein n=1 Tax=Pelagibacterium TaxID=1082930 RepID=UPI002815252F|nr:heme-binding protein [Pelagibacterium sp. H642]WMT91943.1 heme-binding protein [Pelagibacterium sp. H642]
MQTNTNIDIDDARILIAGAVEKANEIGVPMCIAVCDGAGNLVAFERMTGGKVTSITIAIDKAYTAAAAKKATHDYAAASQPGKPAFGINSAINGRLMVVAGGLPIVVRDEVVGSIGISSGTPDEDRLCAQAGLNAFLKAIA